jgi:hypothetical protein
MMTAGGGGGCSIARVYDSQRLGCGVLVDRLWPRGLRKEDAALDEWAKDVAPTAALRRRYGHDRRRFEGFAEGQPGTSGAIAEGRYRSDRNRDVKSPTGPRCVSLSGLTIALMLLI